MTDEQANKVNTGAKTHRCTVDESDQTRVFFEIEGIPVFNNVLWDTPEQAKAAARGDLSLAYCESCGHIHNVRFQEELLDYDVNYENSLHFSRRFQEYIEALCADLIARHTLKGKSIIDVGCGKGDFLKLICKMGGNKGYGFDKSYEPTPEDDALADVTFVQDFFTEAYRDYPADMIACRHVLEHIQFPIPFLEGIRKAVAGRTDTTIFFEVPNALYTLRDLGIWDIIYEHVSYFTEHSLVKIFVNNGFDVQRVSEVYGGQFLTIEATLATGQQGTAPQLDSTLAEVKQLVEDFGKSYREKVQHWQTQLEQMRAAGKKAVIWGSGSKGVTFLNVLPSQGLIEYAVDINSRKQGKYVAGSAQQIVAPQKLKDYQPDVVLIMNPLYENEIKQSVAELGLSPEFYLV